MEEWPDWRGPLLPSALLGHPDAEQHRYVGRHVCAETNGVAEQLLVTLTRRGPSDVLSNKELAAARAYASGQSYKEVAKQLGMAPATVRHYLREVHAKLGINDKASLVRVIDPP